MAIAGWAWLVGDGRGEWGRQGGADRAPGEWPPTAGANVIGRRRKGAWSRGEKRLVVGGALSF